MKKKIAIFVFIFVIILTTPVLAHQGRTDSSGGHYNTSTGEYHYHHGYSAHQHINGLCPYECEIEDIIPSTCEHCKASINPANGFYCFECGYNTIEKYDLYIVSTVDGPASKTRSEYYQEVESLKEDLENKNKTISNLRDKEDEKNKEINSLKKENQEQIKNMIVVFIFIILVVMYISYKVGLNKNRSKK